MLSFKLFLLEYPLSYYEAMPVATVPSEVTAAQKRFGVMDIEWRVLSNKSIHQSEEIDDKVIVIAPGERLENLYHELGHVLYDRSDKDSIKPLLDRIRDKYRVHYRDYDAKYRSRVKSIELGGNWYGYSHSGIEFQHDELFAITFAYEMGGGKFDDADLQKEYEDMLKCLSAGQIKEGVKVTRTSKKKADLDKLFRNLVGESVEIKNKITFVRYGGLSSVPQHGYQAEPESFHLPPARRGIYAFPLQGIERFLMGSEDFISHRQEWVKDKDGKIVDEDHPLYKKLEQNRFGYRDFDPANPDPPLIKTKGVPKYDTSKQRNGKSALVKNKTPIKFQYNGEIWSHLEFPRNEITAQKGSWSLTDMPSYIRAFKKELGQRNMRKRHTGYNTDKDYLEVFIEKV